MGRRPTKAQVQAWRDYCEEIRPTITKLMIARIREEPEVTLWFRQNVPPVEGNSFIFDTK